MFVCCDACLCDALCLCVCVQVDSSLQSLEEMLCRGEEGEGLVGGVSVEAAHELLEQGSALVENLQLEYGRAKTLGKDQGGAGGGAKWTLEVRVLL